MAREYATQMEAARKGIITEELKSVAKKERMSRRVTPACGRGKGRYLCEQKS